MESSAGGWSDETISLNFFLELSGYRRPNDHLTAKALETLCGLRRLRDLRLYLFETESIHFNNEAVQMLAHSCPDLEVCSFSLQLLFTHSLRSPVDVVVDEFFLYSTHDSMNG